MEKVKQISPYYLFYIKGVNEYKLNSQANLKMAVEYLEKALNFKETESAYIQLSNVYARLNDVKMYEKTILRGAEAGFTPFYSLCGLFYANTKPKADKEKSLMWFNKGIESRDPKTYADLAKLYMNGCFAFEKDFDQAESLLQKGLSLHDPKWNGLFAYLLANLCYEKKIYVVAAKYYKKAIEYGYMQATNDLALMYRDGIGVKQDSEKYMDYIMMYLCPENAVEIAGVYLTDQFALPNEEIAFRYFQYAASQGHAVSAIMCAGYLIEKKNANEASINKYLEIAFKNGINNENLKGHFDVIELTLGESVSKKLKELADKYWNMRSSAA